MPPRAFTNPAPKTESARSALSSFTCTLCNKSYSRHPEYEAHISSYDHQHRKRLQDLKQLSRDPNAAEKARRAERKADAEAGLKVLDAPGGNASVKGVKSGGGGGGGGGGGFKKGGFKSSFSTVKGPVAPVRKNVLGDDEEEDDDRGGGEVGLGGGKEKAGGGGSLGERGEEVRQDAESDTDEEYSRDREGGGYYDPRSPTGCDAGCAGRTEVKAAS
ncbi:C2H2 finger domain protein [Penicillium brasilianum]|uniref:C2H2 finger domain protein n=1 Tax=Penicillium brasilianum TaxID=104259 RepID=A0A1S9RN31_PENBI|nr:C2H2 finger domain protein [Penicillium brasilianum]